MSDYFETTAVVTEGKVSHIDNHAAFNDALKRFGDGSIVIRIEPMAQRRSLRQNRYWHAVVIPAFMKELNGESPQDREAFEQMKASLALELIPKTVKDIHGVEHVIPGHTSDLTVAEFKDLIERAQQLGARYGVYVPDAGEYERGAA